MIPPESIRDIADRLATLRFSDADIEGIIGANWLRVASQVWR